MSQEDKISLAGLKLGPPLVRLLCPSHMEALKCWPEDFGGGSAGRRSVLTLVSSILLQLRTSPSNSDKGNEELEEASLCCNLDGTDQHWAVCDHL